MESGTRRVSAREPELGRLVRQARANPDTVAYTKQKPDPHWAAFTLPVAVDLSTGAVEYLDSTPVWGFAMWEGVKKTARQLLGR